MGWTLWRNVASASVSREHWTQDIQNQQKSDFYISAAQKKKGVKKTLSDIRQLGKCLSIKWQDEIKSRTSLA